MKLIVDYGLRERVYRGFVVAFTKLIFTLSFLVLGLCITVYSQLWCTTFCTAFSILIFLDNNVIIGEEEDIL
jgi:hypothetical protein